MDDSAGALENQVELKLELRRISQGQWFLDKFYERARLAGVTSIYHGTTHFVITRAIIHNNLNPWVW